MKVKFCKNCKWSRKADTTKELRCINPYVMSVDSHTLSTDSYEIDEIKVEYNYGVSCWSERDKKSLFAKCGMKGKLWEEKSSLPKWIQERCKEY